MIEQRINLYQDRFRDKRTLISAGQLVTVFLLVLAGLAVLGFFMQRDLDQAQAFNQTLKARQQTIATELESANAELQRLLADNRMGEQIASVSREISARRKVLNFVESNQFGSGEGFSSYLLSLSNLQVENIWLNEIKLAEGYVRIQGSALAAEQVPVYFDRFSDESIFEGNRFDIFKLERDENADWKIDFEIATREVINE